jgi:flagella basal body P-ring formation protein FlgA
MISLAILAAAVGAAPECLTISADRILARDLATAMPAFAAVSPETALGYAPAPGVRRTFASDELRRLLARYDITTGALEPVCFEWKMASPSSEAVTMAMGETLRSTNPLTEPAIEIVEVSRYPAPLGQVEFLLRGLPAYFDPAKPVTWRGQVLYGSGRKFSIWARVRIKGLWPEVVTTGKIRAGDPIREGQVRVHQSTSITRSDVATRVEDVIGLAPNTGLREGAVVRLHALGAANDVRKGDTVRVDARHGNAHIVIEAEAESNGRRGDTITVRNAASGRTFQARVEGPGRAAVGDLALEGQKNP